MIKNLAIFAENCIADAPMLLVKAIFVLILVGIVYGAAVGINIASADEVLPPAEQQKHSQGLDNPANAHPTAYGSSVVAVNYDIHYDGNTCFRWLNDSLGVVVKHPRIITYSDPIDDFDLIFIIACEA